MTETYADERRDRARGAMLGLAMGDALGTTLEFTTRDSLSPQTDLTGGGPFSLAPGVWTDDTSMALALGESLVACRGFDAADVMRRFVAWWQKGEYTPVGRCFDIGNTTAAALGRFQHTGDPLAGSTSEQDAGNGSLMRLAPVPIFAHDDTGLCRTLAAQQSRTTHGAPQAVDACAFFADLLRRAIGGEMKQTLLAPQVITAHEQVRIVAAGGWHGMHRDQIRSTGYVVDTLEAALWAVSQTGTFRDAVILAVNLAGDADTVGAVTGQLAGALYGMRGIPAPWLKKLAWRDRLLACADNLLDARA